MKIKITVSLDDELVEYFAKLAEKDKRSFSSMINKLMSDKKDSLEGK